MSDVSVTVTLNDILVSSRKDVPSVTPSLTCLPISVSLYKESSD